MFQFLVHQLQQLVLNLNNCFRPSDSIKIYAGKSGFFCNAASSIQQAQLVLALMVPQEISYKGTQDISFHISYRIPVTPLLFAISQNHDKSTAFTVLLIKPLILKFHIIWRSFYNSSCSTPTLFRPSPLLEVSEIQPINKTLSDGELPNTVISSVLCSKSNVLNNFHEVSHSASMLSPLDCLQKCSWVSQILTIYLVILKLLQYQHA